jgi:hypothetical protein
MSASVYWLPSDENPKGRQLQGQSGFAAALKLPRVFKASDVKWLEGYAAGDPKSASDVEELIDAIERFGAVRVWVEY